MQMSLDRTCAVTSVRYDTNLLACKENTELGAGTQESCPYYMLRYHVERLTAAIEELGYSCMRLQRETGVDYLAIKLDDFRSGLDKDSRNNSPAKLRVVVDRAGGLLITMQNVPLQPTRVFFPDSLDRILHESPTYAIYLASKTVMPSTLTRHKTTNRSMYDRFRSMLPPTCDGLIPEILLINDDEELMESTICSPYVKLDKKWITPAMRCGGNVGTTRSWALRSGICQEGCIKGKKALHDLIGSEVVLSNGVRGFGWGIVKAAVNAEDNPETT